jgi:hypothetical protein
MVDLNVVPSPDVELCLTKKSIRLLSSSRGHSHLGLVPGSAAGADACSASPSDWLELLRVCILGELGVGYRVVGFVT